MKRNYKKVLAGFLATSMVLGSSMVAFAAPPETGTTSGTGELEGTVDTEVYVVVLPTISTPDTTFNFILDPEGLIAKTNAARYNKTFEEGATLFFENANGTTDYSSTSDALVVTNKSSIPVDVKLEATIADATGITLTDDKTFAGDTDASIYLALTDGTNTKPLTDAGVELTSKLEYDTDAYEMKWDATANAGSGAYVYELTDAAKAQANTDFPQYSFKLTGASNAAGDWSALASAAPKVNVTWTVDKHVEAAEAAPSIATKTYSMTSGSPVAVNVSLGAGSLAATGIASITYTSSSGASRTMATSDYSLNGNTLTFSANYIQGVIQAGVTSRVYKVIFNDEASTAVDITFTTSS